MAKLDKLIRNDYRLTFWSKDKGYRIVFSTPGRVSIYDLETYGEARDQFKPLALEFDMVGL